MTSSSPVRRSRLLSVLSAPRRPARGWHTAARIAFGGYFAAMAGVNVLVTLPDPEGVYRGLAELSWPGFAWIPEYLAQPIGGPFTMALIVWEAGVAGLLLSKGKLVRLIAALLQVVALAPFLGWYELPNVATAVLVAALLRRDHDSTAVDVLRRHLRRRTTLD
jgi:hypothetical protein